MTKLEHISFNFPQNLTYSENITDLEKFERHDFTNKNVHVKFLLDKELKKNFNQDQLAKEIQEKTNASGIKVSFIYNQISNLRSQEIAEQQDLIKKFQMYAKLNDIKYKDSVLAKIEDIQNHMLIDLSSPNDAYTLKYLSLRGSIGIKDGQRKDEIELFFDKYDTGIIGLVGVNGAGKSTLIENCHPFPSMLTRTGSLKDHFCLKDSHRILIYETPTGKQLKITMLIDAMSKCISSKYYVEVKEPDGAWEPVKSVDGTHDSYVEFVKNTFGSKEIFLRTSFYPKEAVKGMSELSQATKSEKMALFSVLAGTDYLSSISNSAKELIREEEKVIEKIKGQIKDFDEIENKIETFNNIITSDNEEIEKYISLVDEDLKSLEDFEEKQKTYIASAATYDIFRNQANEERVNCENLNRKLMSIKNNIEGLQEQLSDIDTYREQLKWIDENMAKRKELQIEDTKLRSEHTKLSIEIEKANEQIKAHERSQTEAELMIKTTNEVIDRLTKSIPKGNDVCPMCGSPLSEHKKEKIENEIKEINRQISEHKDKLKQLSTTVADEEAWLMDNSISEKKEAVKNINNKLISISNDIRTIDGYAATIDVDYIKDVIKTAEPHLESEKENYAETKKMYDESLAKLKELTNKIENTPADYSDKIERLKRGIVDSRQIIAEKKAEVNFATKEMEKLSQLSETIESIKSEVKVHQQNVKDYTIIQNAFGNNGIQALELDSAAPEISSITNNILLETYGDRFTVSFDTQRDTKDGRKIDDFVINVYDSERGRMKRLDYLCSGESVWIKQALHFAFSVIRTRRTGFCFKTRFLDETDGSLDSDARVKYLKMIEAAHCQCNAYQTILITHSQEIKEILEQKIEL